jgi:hypothetical protein
VRRIAARALSAALVAFSTVSVSGSAAAEPDSPQRCDAKFFVQHVDALFAALTSGNPTRIAALFPNPKTWTFHFDSEGKVVSERGGLRIEPSSGTADALAAAVRQGNTHTIAALFPSAGHWQLELVPTIDGFIRNGSLSRSKHQRDPKRTSVGSSRGTVPRDQGHLERTKRTSEPSVGSGGTERNGLR